MSSYRHLELVSEGTVSRVRLMNHRPCYGKEIAELMREWNSVADRADCQTLSVDCSHVRFVSSEILSKLILLHRRLNHKDGRLVLCGLCPEVRELLRWTKLDQLFEIEEDAGQEVAAIVKTEACHFEKSCRQTVGVNG